MKRLVIALVVIVILIGAGYKAGFKYVSEVIMNKVTDKVLSGEGDGQQPARDSQAQDAENENDPDTVNNNEPLKNADGGLVFDTAEEALLFLMTKFSKSELKGFLAMTEDGLTAEEKNQIKAALLARLTPEEYQALRTIGIQESQRNPNLKY